MGSTPANRTSNRRENVVTFGRFVRYGMRMQRFTLSLLSLAAALAACAPVAPSPSDGIDPSEDGLTYRHPTIGYTVRLPEDWRGKVEVREETTEEDAIEITSFDYVAGGDPETFVFRIAAYPRSVWMAMMPTLNTEPFASDDRYVYALIRSLDNPYEGASQAEYGDMALDIDGVIDSFELEGALPFGTGSAMEAGA